MVKSSVIGNPDSQIELLVKLRKTLIDNIVLKKKPTKKPDKERS